MKLLQQIERGVIGSAQAIGRGIKQDFRRNVKNISSDVRQLEKVGSTVASDLVRIAPVAQKVSGIASKVLNTVAVPVSTAFPIIAPELLLATAGANSLNEGLKSFNKHLAEGKEVQSAINSLRKKT